jgi:phospholipid/cholesterol/gamma-HCH transport system substrate-binding protein
MPFSKRTLRIALAAFLVLGLGGFVFRGQQGTQVTAYFDEFKGIYVGDDVTVRGVPVGTVTSVDPEPDRVRVEFQIDDDIHVPDDVKAAVIAQSLVSVRSIALGPVDSDGQALEDGAVIPQSRTAIPVEWDDIKDQLVELSTALGPTGANKRGATSELISAGAEFLDGQGAPLNATISNLSEAMSTLSDNSGELFATVRNLQVFISAIKDSDSQVRMFNQRLATVAASLNEDRRALVGALEGLNGAFGKIDTFLKQNRDLTVSTLKELRSTTSVLAQNRQYIADLLQVAPTGISNFYNILDPRGTSPIVTGVLAANNLQAPAQIICGALLTLGGDRAACQEAIGPLAKYFAMTAPPVGIGGVQSDSAGEAGTIEPGSQSPPRTTTTDQANLLDQLLGGQR